MRSFPGLAVIVVVFASSCGSAPRDTRGIGTPTASTGGEPERGHETAVDTVSSGTGCPPARAVRHARWLVAEGGGPVASGSGYWAIRLGYLMVDDGAPAPGPITAEALAARGIETGPSAVWVLRSVVRMKALPAGWAVG